MGNKTKISWCDSTANPVVGCSKVSPGCLNCYAEQSTPARVLRARGIETWGTKGVRHTLKGFRENMLAMNRKPWVCDVCGEFSDGGQVFCKTCGHKPNQVIEALSAFHRRRVFIGSLCDLFDPAWSAEQLAETLDVMRQCTELDQIICTKRSENFNMLMNRAMDHADRDTAWWAQGWDEGKHVPNNITILTTVENQEQADARIPELLRIPSARRGISCEPLLGPIDLNTSEKSGPMAPIDWVIVGGESGPNARPCNVEWIRDIVRQCAAASAPCFVKQIQINGKISTNPMEWPADLRVQQFPK